MLSCRRCNLSLAMQVNCLPELHRIYLDIVLRHPHDLYSPRRAAYKILPFLANTVPKVDPFGAPSHGVPVVTGNYRRFRCQSANARQSVNL